MKTLLLGKLGGGGGGGGAGIYEASRSKFSKFETLIGPYFRAPKRRDVFLIAEILRPLKFAETR